MTSEAGLLLFKIGSNCYPLPCWEGGPSHLPPRGSRSLPFLSRHSPCDPSPGRYPALAWSGMLKLPLSPPWTPTSGSLICQAQVGRGFWRMTSDSSLCRAHGHPIKQKLQRWEVRFLGDGFLGDGFRFSTEHLSLHPA